MRPTFTDNLKYKLTISIRCQ